MSKEKSTLFQQLSNSSDSNNQFKLTEPSSPLKYRALIIISTILLCAFFFIFNLQEGENKPYKYDNFPRMEEWQGKTVYADFTFPIYKDKVTLQNEIDSAKKFSLEVYRIKPEIAKQTIDKVRKIVESLPEITPLINDNSDFRFEEDELKPFIELSTEDKKRKVRTIKREVIKFYEEVYSSGFIDREIENIRNNEIKLFKVPNEEIIVKKAQLYDKERFIEEAEILTNLEMDSITKPMIFSLIKGFTIPNLYYDQELSEQQRKLAERSIPRTIGIIRKDETVVKNGQKLNDTLRLRIQSYERSKMMTSENIYSSIFILGSMGHASIIYGILLLYLFVIRKDIFYNNLKLGTLSGLLVFSSLLSWVSIEIITELPVELLIMVPAFSMLAAIVFDSRTAFYVTVTMSLMLAGIRGNDYITGATMIIAGTLAAYTVKDVQNRTLMFQSMFYIFLGLIIPTIVFGAERSENFSMILQKGGFLIINSAISPLLTFGLLFLIEKTSNITTDLKIKEYDNLNHDLLVKMSEVAPGTYQHTLGVAFLSERAARAIGANELLVKVAAYFHDIGKIEKSEYFTENQIGFENKHDKLPPKKSADIIRNHVPEGIKLAERYKLPERLIDFIPMHHGTDLIKHFYAKALEESIIGAAVDENDYRYQGPKPNTREAAVLMICDSAEAISRVSDQNMEEIEKKISQNIQERLLDGQFDDANITIKEINIIKETILKSLLGSGHKRTSYKEMPKK